MPEARAHVFNHSLYPISKGQDILLLSGLLGLFHLTACRHFRGLAGVKKNMYLIDKARPSQELHINSFPLCQLLVCPLRLQECLSCYSVETPYTQILTGRWSLDQKEVNWAKWQSENSGRKCIPFVRWFSE